MMLKRNYFKMKRLLIVALLLSVSMTTPPGKITVYLIGDSTMADKRPGAFPEMGWGTPFKTFFDSSVVINNHAKNGRSTRTFVSEGLWAPIVQQLREGDYVFIQFGHNDEAKEKTDRYTSPEDYKRNLRKFIDETRGKKATPVLLTPVSRRRFDELGNVRETHMPYSDLVADVARDTDTYLIDLDKLSRELLQEFGPQQSKLLFLQLEAGEHPNYPEGKNDNTHFNELGARKIAQIVLSQIVKLRLELADRIVKPEKKK